MKRNQMNNLLEELTYYRRTCEDAVEGGRDYIDETGLVVCREREMGERMNSLQEYNQELQIAIIHGIQSLLHPNGKVKEELMKWSNQLNHWMITSFFE